MSEIDPTNEQVVAAAGPPAKLGLLNRQRIEFYLGRVVVLLTALTAALSSAALVLTDADLTTTVGVLGFVVALVPVVVKFLEGVQSHEKAGYTYDLHTRQAEAQLAIIEAEGEAAQKIGGRANGPRIQTPGR